MLPSADPAPFGQRVAAAVARTGPVCAGIDPSGALLGAWGLPDSAAGLRSFAGRCVEAFAGVVPVVKPQVAFFERHGAAGLAVLERLVAEAADAGLLVICDAKRGDVDSTAEAYADAWLGEGSPLAADAVTASPYLGLGALAPMVTAARRTGRGLLVVARSSNAEGRPVQDAVGADGLAVGDAVLDGIAALNREEGLPVGSAGAVVGATLGPDPALAALVSSVGGVLLVPGVGAQGGTAAQVAALFGRCAPGTVLPSVSRSVLAAGPDVRRLQKAAALVRDDLAAVLV